MWIEAVVVKESPLLGKCYKPGQAVWVKPASGGFYHVHAGFGLTGRILSGAEAAPLLRTVKSVGGGRVKAADELQKKLDHLWQMADF